LNTSNGGSKRWIYEQYDQTIQGNTIEPFSGNAALIRLPNSLRGLALTTDVTPRYCAADPFEGAKQAVAEAYRNITAVGATPKAITNCLNFGSPEDEDVMGQLIASIEGLREACLALDLPIISGNVSLYNQTGHHPIFPTPTVGCIGLLQDITKRVTSAFKKPGDAVLLIGHTQGWLGQSSYARDILHQEVGAPPPVDLDEEKRHACFVRSLIAEGAVTAVRDCSHGGLLVALAKMALASFEEQEPCGIILQPEAWPKEYHNVPKHAFFFGEDQGRYIITIHPSYIQKVNVKAKEKDIPLIYLGRIGGSHIVLPEEEPLSLRELKTIYEIPLISRLSYAS
jgi:phosphoribosylformylglycinamidine synthase